MEPLAIAVFAVLVIGVGVGAYFSRLPPAYDEIGGPDPLGPGERAGDEPDGPPAPPIDDEADLRALVAAKRARRRASGGASVASDRLRGGGAAADPDAAPWSHLEAEVVEEARGLVARRRARLERAGKAVPDEDAELRRLLGPPTPGG